MVLWCLVVRNVNRPVTIFWMRRGWTILEYLQRTAVYTSVSESRSYRYTHLFIGEGCWEEAAWSWNCYACFFSGNPLWSFVQQKYIARVIYQLNKYAFPIPQHLPWDRLERRQLEPPFKPALDHTLDTKYFDTAFTTERPRLTPVPEQILTSMDQNVFRGFSYTNPNATDWYVLSWNAYDVTNLTN